VETIALLERNRDMVEPTRPDEVMGPVEDPRTI